MERLTQAEISRRTGIPKQTISDICRARTRTSKEKAQLLEKVTGIYWLAWIYPEEFPNPYIRRNKHNQRANARS